MKINNRNFVNRLSFHPIILIEKKLFVACKHFNITKAKSAKKCSFAAAETIGRGYALSVGQTYDPRCQTCAIREYVCGKGKGPKIIEQ